MKMIRKLALACLVLISLSIAVPARSGPPATYTVIPSPYYNANYVNFDFFDSANLSFSVREFYTTARDEFIIYSQGAQYPYQGPDFNTGDAIYGIYFPNGATSGHITTTEYYHPEYGGFVTWGYTVTTDN